MESKGNDALLKTTKVTEWNLNNGGYTPLAFGGLILLGCVIAYVIAVARGNVDAVLPLISDAAGSPPQNGFFGTLVCLGGMFGVVFMIQRYMIVLEKNKGKSSLVLTLNKLSLVIGILSMLSITLVTGYPINFYRNRDVWMNDVGIPHMIGGVLLFSLGLVYIALQCILTLFLKQKHENVFSLRILLLFICTSAFVYHMITVPEHFGGVSHLYYSNETVVDGVNKTAILPYPPTMGTSLKIPIDTGGSYFNSAVAQWMFVFFFCCFFFTFFKEFQEYNMLIVIETHFETQTAEETQRPDYQKQISLISNASQISKADSEVRKLLRRDSTCQTMTDPNDILSSKNGITNGKKDGQELSKNDAFNGKAPRFNSEVDAKLTRLLSVCETADEELKHQSKETSVAETNTTSDAGINTTSDAGINTTSDAGTNTTSVAGTNTTSVAGTNTTSVDMGSNTTTADAGTTAPAKVDEGNALPKETDFSVSKDSSADEDNQKTSGTESSESIVANALVENIMSDIQLSKEDKEKEEERIAIEQIDVAVKEAEDSTKMKTQEKETVEPQPSNCPMSVQ